MNKTDQDYFRCEVLLKSMTGNENSIAVAGLGTKDEYQVMPDEVKDQDFFDWYCETYPNEQFFSNIYECVVRYATIKKWYDLGNRGRMIVDHLLSA